MEYNLQSIKPKQILPTIQNLQDRLDYSKKNLDSLTNDLSDHKDIISDIENKTKEKWFSSSPSKSDLFELIKSDQKSNGKTAIAISKLFKSVNENTSDLAKMVACLAQLSSMTYNDIKESFEKIKDNKSSLSTSNNQIEKGNSQLNQIISMHLERAKKDYERDQLFTETQERIDLTLGGANDKIKELENSIQHASFLNELNEKLKIKSSKIEVDKSKISFYKALSVISILISLCSILFIISVNYKIF